MTIQQAFLLLSLAGNLALPASAQGQKIGTIDLRQTFARYWRAKQADSVLQVETAELDKARQTMVDQLRKEQEDYKKLLDSADETAVSADEQGKRKKSAAEALEKLKGLQTQAEQRDRQSRTGLGEKQRRMRETLLEDIRNVIKARAKAGNYTLILNTSAESLNNTPVVLYTSGEGDITEEVVKELNTNAPLSPKAPETQPSTDPAEKADPR